MSYDFPHRVTYSETDQMGFVYYANYFVFFEIGRTELIRAAGLAYRELEEMGYFLPVIEASCHYLGPARYDDLLMIRTRVTEFKGVKLRFGYEVIRDGKTLAEGMTLHAFMDGSGKPKKLTPSVKERIEKAFLG